MGCFYTNYTLRGPSQIAVATALAGRRALVAPLRDGCTVAFDDESDHQNEIAIASLASKLSGELACPVLAVINHDDDFLWYRLYLNGRMADEYNSLPGYFDRSAGGSVPSGGDAEQLCAAFDATDVLAVQRTLRGPSFGVDAYAFAHERHADLARALALPGFAVGVSYANFERGQHPEGLSAADMLKASGAPAAPTKEEIQRRRDLEFYDRLGAEDSSRRCKREGCTRGTIKQSVLCRPHHFKMIRGHECPFDH